MHEPANTQSHATAIGLALGVILAAALFLVMLTEPKARTPHRQPNSTVGLYACPREITVSSEAKFLHECERFGRVLDQCMTPSTPAPYVLTRTGPAVAILR
jgi:hypothetical protein